MKKLLVRLFLFFKGDAILRRINKTPRILFYHGIDNVKYPEIETENIDISVFEKQIEYLIKHYEIISIEEFDKRFRENKFTNKEIVLTFDDGYANNLYIVKPILSKYNLPFTVFASTEHIDTGHFFPTSINRIIVHGAGLDEVSIPSQGLVLSLVTEKERDYAASTISNLLKTMPLDDMKTITQELINNVSAEEWKSLEEKHKSQRPMTWDELIELSKRPNVTIGSHCRWHICCHSNQKEEIVREEIEESKRDLENKLEQECKYFAYPNGDFTDYSNEIVEKNYSMGFSTNRTERVSKNNNLAIMPRISVPSKLSIFKIIINI